MRKLILISVAALPLLALLVYAEQSYSGFGEAFGYGSEEAGTGAYLGVDISDITPDRVAALKLRDEHGVEVTMVDQDAPAGKAGLKEHDVILSLNGTPVESGAQLRRMIRETPPGRIVTLNVSRDGQPMTLKAQLADRTKTMSSWAPKAKEFKFTMPPVPPVPEFDVPVSVVVVHSSMRSGLMVENITPQLGEFFGVKNGNGVLIRSVEKGSRADKAGFKAGDVVVKVNDQAVHDTSDFTHALRSRAGDSVSVSIVRDKKEQTITLTLPDRKESGTLLEEETIEIPDVDVQAGLADVRKEMARIQPQIQLAIEESRRALSSAGLDCEETRRRLEEQRQELQQQQQELEEQQQQLQEQERELDQELHRSYRSQLPI